MRRDIERYQEIGVCVGWGHDESKEGGFIEVRRSSHVVDV